MFGRRLTRGFTSATVLSLVLAATTLGADQLWVDGDDANGIQSVDLGQVCPSGSIAPATDNATLWLTAVNRNAAPFFLNGETVSLTATSVPAGLSATGSSITVPSDWETLSQTDSETTTTKISLTDAGTTEGARSATIEYTATGNGVTKTATGRDPRETGPVSLKKTVGVTWFVLDDQDPLCAPPPPSDTTPPQISYVLNPASPDGDNGWYKSNVTLTWTVTETESAGSLVKTGCEDQNIAADQAATTYSCSATSDGGSAGPVTVSIKRDGTAPTIAFTSAAASETGGGPNASGWYKSAVTATFTASDNLAGFAAGFVNPFGVPSGTAEGQLVYISSLAAGSVTDMAGNGAASYPNAGPFKIDLTDPQNAVTGVAQGTTYTLGSVPTAGCTTTDPGSDPSGVATSATVSVTGGTPNGVGSFTATCTGGSDNAGRTAAAASVTYSVWYAGVSGILQPINPDNSSVFSRGRAVPVKFQLGGDEPLGFGTGSWTVQRLSVNCSTMDDDTTLENVPSNTPSSLVRYDSTADQYIYNADFKDKAAGTCWKIRVTLDSGQTLDSAVFRLQK